MIEAVSKMKNTTLLNEGLTVASSLNEDTYAQLEQLADTIAESLQ